MSIKSYQTYQKEGVEILCIGTELLLGNILNSNAKWLAEELAYLGMPHYIQTVVGDNKERLKTAILDASKRSKILITTGGLGPTPDDLTTETIALAFNSPLKENSEVWEDIKQKLNIRNHNPLESNRKQSLFPVNAEIIPNPNGTAPGMIWEPKKDFVIITFPGVPSEMRKMWKQSAINWFHKNGGDKNVFASRTMKFAGISESQLAEMMNDLLKYKNPTVAPYANLGEVKLRLTAKAKDTKAANLIINPLEKEIIKRSGSNYYGSDEETLSSTVVKLLKEKNQTLAVAESCTGGGLGASITTISGSSEIFLGGLIAYKNIIKKDLLNVSDVTLEKNGAVSNAVVESMAKGVSKLFNSDWAIAISGIAGPSGDSDTKPIGLVHFAIMGPIGVQTYEQSFGKKRDRIDIQRLSVVYALNYLRLQLLAQR